MQESSCTNSWYCLDSTDIKKIIYCHLIKSNHGAHAPWSYCLVLVTEFSCRHNENTHSCDFHQRELLMTWVTIYGSMDKEIEGAMVHTAILKTVKYRVIRNRKMSRTQCQFSKCTHYNITQIKGFTANTLEWSPQIIVGKGIQELN